MIRRNRIPKTVGLTILCMAISLAILINQGSAQCLAPPTTCNLVDSSGNKTHYWLSIAPDTVGNWPFLAFDIYNQPIYIGDAQAYEWAYRLTADPGYSTPQVNQVSILAPDCCGMLSYSVPSGGSVYLPGAGDPTAPNFGLGNFQDYVIRLAYNSSSPRWSHLTNKLAPFQATSVQIKSGNSRYYCKSIAGPSCVKEETIMVTQKRVYNPKRKIWICSDIDPFTGCEKNLTNCTDETKPTPLEMVPLSSISAGVSPTPLSQIAVDGAKCPTVDLDTTGDHTWYRCSGGWCYY